MRLLIKFILVSFLFISVCHSQTEILIKLDSSGCNLSNKSIVVNNNDTLGVMNYLKRENEGFLYFIDSTVLIFDKEQNYNIKSEEPFIQELVCQYNYEIGGKHYFDCTCKKQLFDPNPNVLKDTLIQKSNITLEKIKINIR